MITILGIVCFFMLVKAVRYQKKRFTKEYDKSVYRKYNNNEEIRAVFEPYQKVSGRSVGDVNERTRGIPRD